MESIGLRYVFSVIAYNLKVLESLFELRGQSRMPLNYGIVRLITDVLDSVASGLPTKTYPGLPG